MYLKIEIKMRNIEGSKILVTGGAGFIGSLLYELLKEDIGEVVIYDNLARERCIT